MKLFSDKSVRMTLPEVKVVHGIEVKKVPVGRYLQAMSLIEALPERFIHRAFPGMTLSQVLEWIAGEEGEVSLLRVAKLFFLLPEPVIEVLCVLLELDKEKVMNEMTPAQVFDVLEAFWKENDLTSFFTAAWAALKRAFPTLTTGFSGGSPAPKA